MFSFLFLVNPGVISAIIGALIGSISAWTLSYFTEERKFNRKKKGAYALLKSEIEINVSNLKRYKKNYLIKNTKELYNNGNLNGKVGRFSFPKIGKRGQSKTNVIIFL